MGHLLIIMMQLLHMLFFSPTNIFVAAVETNCKAQNPLHTKWWAIHYALRQALDFGISKVRLYMNTQHIVNSLTSMNSQLNWMNRVCLMKSDIWCSLIFCQTIYVSGVKNQVAHEIANRARIVKGDTEFKAEHPDWMRNLFCTL
uniref:RNase H type-1 domain-containing protein n=1 Tax=Nelumbo nucifera TaxID=4432 RepID=A0A822Y2Q5_NELNU|nr:TPA_asm: hypothetical protein HUJ06_028195 [Nelumbo nucifera]